MSDFQSTKLPPVREANRMTVGKIRACVTGLVDRIEVRAEYLTEAQRDRLRELAERRP